MINSAKSPKIMHRFFCSEVLYDIVRLFSPIIYEETNL